MLFLGDNLLAWMVLALGAALAVGTGLAMVRPPPTATRSDDDLDRAPVGRSVVMIAVGTVASIWALASLLTAS